jgi:hypothetical protein
MKYLCLGYQSESAVRTMSGSEQSAIAKESLAYQEQLRRSGHYLDGKMLQEPRTAATIRFDNGKVCVTDGPFAETKEQLGGVILIEASDLNHAIQLMSQMPCARAGGGSIEIRPIDESNPFHPEPTR